MKTNVTAEIVKITPEIATEWLAERWGEQRTVRMAHVNRLASDMNSGRFKISPDAILRIKGKLANGQHRLNAVVKAGKAQCFLVMESNDQELYKVIDAGLKRSVSDGLLGIPYACKIPPIARWVQVYHSGRLAPTSKNPSDALGRSLRSFPTQCETIEYCLEHRDVLAEAAAFTFPHYEQSRLIPMSIMASIYVISSEPGKREDAKQFIKFVLRGGSNSAAEDLRNRMIANKGSKSRLPAGYIFGIVLKSFKSFLNDTRPGLLRWASGEPFPEI